MRHEAFQGVRLDGCLGPALAQCAIKCEMLPIIEFSKSSYPISPGHSSLVQHKLPVIQQVIKC